MDIIDVNRLLKPISTEAPSGPDLAEAGDPDFQSMVAAADAQPAQHFGDSVKPAKDPDWRSVRKHAIIVLERSKDLRALTHLQQALTALNGFDGLQASLKLANGLVEHFWPTLHPQLDPDDDNDPLQRLNHLGELTSLRVVGPLKRAALLSDPAIGPITIRNWLVAKGQLTLPEDERTDAQRVEVIESVLSNCPIDILTGVEGTLSECIAQLDSLNERLFQLTQELPFPADEAPLRALLVDARTLIGPYLGRPRTAAVDPPQASAASPQAQVDSSAHQPPPRPSQQRDIASRADVQHAIDQILRYYEAHEPSSPVPYVLRRARALVTMDFLDIVSDLLPNARDELERSLVVKTE